MTSHPIDPVALVAGLVAVVAGLVAVLHQGGAISLNLPLVILLALLAVGIGGASLVLLESRKRGSVRGPH